MSKLALPKQNYLLKKIHISWLFMWLSVGILVGVAILGLGFEGYISGTWLVLLALVGLITMLFRRVWMVLLVLFVGASIGMWRGIQEQADRAEYQQFFGSYVTVSGVVHDDVTLSQSGDQRIRLSKVLVNDLPVMGVVWLSVASNQEIKRGDSLVIEGLMREGFGTFAAVVSSPKILSLAQPMTGDVARRLRDWFGNGVARAIDAPEAGLGMAYLFGQKNTVSDEIVEQFRVSGLVHIIVASGFHLTVLVMVIRRLLENRSKYITVVSASIVVLGFIAITGMSPSMTRAGVIVGLSLAAWYYGRVMHPIILLTISAAITVVWNPAYLWGDVGWYLSFTSFAGVIILAPLLYAYFFGAKKRPGIVMGTIVTTIAAQIATAPIIVYTFEYYSMYSVVANLLIVPLVPLTMVCIFVSGVSGIVFPFASQLIGWPAEMLLRYMLHIADIITRLPGAKSEIIISEYAVVGSYALLIAVTAYLLRKTRYNFREKPDLL